MIGMTLWYHLDIQFTEVKYCTIDDA